MRISDWSSDVCSSDLLVDNIRGHVSGAVLGRIPPERGPEGPTKPGYLIDGGHVHDTFPLPVLRDQIEPAEHESARLAADLPHSRALIGRREHPTERTELALFRGRPCTGPGPGEVTPSPPGGFAGSVQRGTNRTEVGWENRGAERLV